MSEINKYNYEAWLLDYAEGDLTKAQEKQVDQFLDNNPEIKAEFEMFQPVYLEPDTSITFNRKDDLLKEEKRGGRVLFFNFTTGIAAAAAIIIAMIAIVPLFWNNSGPTEMTAMSEVPTWNTPEVGPAIENNTTTNSQMLAESQSTKQVGNTTNATVEPNKAEPVLYERENIDGLTAMSQESISEINTYEEEYYYGQSKVFAGINRTPSDLNYIFPENQPSYGNNNLINSILNTEVARAFIPEAIEEDMPESRRDPNSAGGPTIYLNLPPAGKKIVDKILN